MKVKRDSTVAKKRPVTAKAASKVDIDKQIQELAILAEALKDWGERMAGTYWQEGDADISRFPILVAARVDAIAGEIEARLAKPESEAAHV